jgi:hypothetical protein
MDVMSGRFKVLYSSYSSYALLLTDQDFDFKSLNERRCYWFSFRSTGDGEFSGPVLIWRLAKFFLGWIAVHLPFFGFGDRRIGAS